jgi:hypothetical protein
LATVLAIPFVPPGIPILIAAVVAAAMGWFGYRRKTDPDVATELTGDDLE